jgi:glycosyltransferase involved in cell wall biosynthesis
MQLMPSLKVSIITVVYNRKKTIARAIESVLKQSYQEIEYIIIDGCSTDGTVEILQTYNDGRISKLISEPDGGIYSALNKGLQLATGDVVGFIHSDDFLAHENVVAQLASVFEKDETCDMVYGDLSFFDSENIDKVTRNYSSKFFKTWMMRFALQPAHPTV